MPDADLRQSIEHAFEVVEQKETVNAEPKEERKEESPPVSEEKPVVEQKTEEKPVEEEKAPTDTVPDVEKKAKDEPKPEKQPKTEVKGKKAPVSWRPAAREQWDALPDAIKDEILKREDDVKKVNDGKAVDGQFRSQFEKTIAPFRNYIEANGGDPFRSVHNLMATAAMLHGGTAQQKAELVKNVIKNFSVDVEMLDKALAGDLTSAKAPTVDVAGEVKKAMQPFFETVARTQQQTYNTRVQAFMADPKHEFAMDVADDMADLMEIAAKRGLELTLDQAYERACRSNPEIAKVLDERKSGDRRRKEQEELEAKKNASSSVSGSPGGVSKQNKENMTLRDTIGAAFDQVASR